MIRILILTNDFDFKETLPLHEKLNSVIYLQGQVIT